MKSDQAHSESARFGPLKRLQISILGAIGWALVGAVGASLRYRVEGWENFKQLRSQRKPIILVFWHNQILYATYFWRFRGIVVMTSRHSDGETIARIIGRFGFGTARGSSARGGTGALRVLKRCLDGGADVAFTADGPRGPRYRAKPGPLWLSAKCEAPILPFHLEPRRYWSLESWDRFRIPKPFSEVLVKIGEPFIVESENPQRRAQCLQQEMDRLTRYGEGYWSDPSQPSADLPRAQDPGQSS